MWLVTARAPGDGVVGHCWAWVTCRWISGSGWGGSSRSSAPGAGRVTDADIETYLVAQVSDTSHRDVVGPLLAASGASGVVRVAGREVAALGDPDVPEMAFSVTKSVVSVVAGLAFDDGLLVPDQPVHEVVDVPEFQGPHNEQITWRHLLQQSNQRRASCGASRRASTRRASANGPRCTARPRARGGRTTTCGSTCSRTR